MLTTYMNNLPLTKFILIEDSVEEKGDKILEYLISKHKLSGKYKIHYFVFGNVFHRVKSVQQHPQIKCYNFTIDSSDFKQTITNIHEDAVIVIDSLAHLVHEFSGQFLMNLLNNTLNKSNIQQVITLLHQDMLEDPALYISMFEYLSTLSMRLVSMPGDMKSRVLFTHKKPGGKIAKEIEEYWFEGNNLVSESLKKLDPKVLVQDSMAKATPPELLTTFKIGLEDREKKERDNLVLPYLPKEHEVDEEEIAEKTGIGKIIYQMEEADDWDEEDPDDDLDF